MKYIETSHYCALCIEESQLPVGAASSSAEIQEKVGIIAKNGKHHIEGEHTSKDSFGSIEAFPDILPTKRAKISE